MKRKLTPLAVHMALASDTSHELGEPRPARPGMLWMFFLTCAGGLVLLGAAAKFTLWCLR